MGITKFKPTTPSRRKMAVLNSDDLNSVDLEKIDHISSEYVYGIKKVEEPDFDGNIDSLFSELGPFNESSDVSFDVVANHPEMGIKYMKNELLVMPIKGFDLDILEMQFELVGVQIFSQEGGFGDMYSIQFSSSTNYNQFKAAEIALEESAQIDFVVPNVVMEPF
mgnify:FL=1